MTNLKISKELSEAINRRTDNTMTNRNRTNKGSCTRYI